MPPQRAKLYNKTGKVKVIKQQSKPSSSSSNQGNNSADRSEPVPSTSTAGTQQEDLEAERQFMVELYWCVQQLENSLNSGKLNQKQTQETEKSLKILKSSNQPIVKKRQIMRASFGDYRAKMAEEEKKFSLGSKQIKFTISGTSTKGKKSYFVKKSALMTSGKDFKFNFPINEIEQLNISEKEQEINEENQKIDDSKNEESHENDNGALEADNKTNSDDVNSSTFNFKYVPSSNAFRFNFNVDAEAS